MVSIQPELWTHLPGSAVAFYREGFGARVLHLVGEGEDVVAQLAVGDAVFWVGGAGPEHGRLDPKECGGLTGRTLLVVDDPDSFVTRAVAAGATLAATVADEHGWRLGRLIDPAGHEWEIGHPLGTWPPD